MSLASIESRVEAFLKDLEGKGEEELKNLYADALIAESDAKREVTILAQRAANLAADVDTDAQEAVIVAKDKLADAIAWVQALLQKLGGQVSDHNASSGVAGK